MTDETREKLREIEDVARELMLKLDRPETQETGEWGLAEMTLRRVRALLEAEEESEACPPHGPWLYSVECNAYECQTCGNLFDNKEPYPAPEPEPEEGDPWEPEEPDASDVAPYTLRVLEERIEALGERLARIEERHKVHVGLKPSVAHPFKSIPTGNTMARLEALEKRDEVHSARINTVEARLRSLEGPVKLDTPEPDSEPEPPTDRERLSLADVLDEITVSDGDRPAMDRAAQILRSRPSKEAGITLSRALVETMYELHYHAGRALPDSVGDQHRQIAGELKAALESLRTKEGDDG